MNIYYFLNLSNTIDGFEAKINICNFAPMPIFYKNKLKEKFIKIFYLNNKKWNVIIHSKIKRDESKVIKQKDLPNFLNEKSLFLYLSDNEELNINDLNDSYDKSEPTWRSNIGIGNEHCFASYQGEIPYTFFNNKVSLVSCSPMLQNKNGSRTYFILVNLFKEPNNNSFQVDIHTLDKKKIKSVNFSSNTINCVDITNIINDYEMLVFKSSENGGIPLYLNMSYDQKQISIEHTHPPVEYVYGGNRQFFQKAKKNFWFKS